MSDWILKLTRGKFASNLLQTLLFEAFSVCKCLEEILEQTEKGKWWDILRRLCLEGRWRKINHYNNRKWCSEREKKIRNERIESPKPEGGKSDSEGKGEV